MPFIVTTPSALGSVWDYDISWQDPWTNWNGTQTWEQLVNDVRAATGYGTDIIDRIRNTYYIRKRLRFVGIDMLVPLLDATIICEQGGLLGFHAGCDIQFGQPFFVSGVETGSRGCTIIEDTGSASREADNFNKNTRIVMNSTLRLYDTTFRRNNTTRSDFDWAADSLIVMRDVILQMRGNHFNHFYGQMDIDGLEIQTQSGSSLEFRTAEAAFIKFDNVFPYRLDGNEDQRVLVMFVPVGATDLTNIYTFRNYKGVNFARWSLGGGRSATFINPYYPDLQSVGANSGRSGHAFEKRTLFVGVSDADGAPIESARVQIQHKADGFTIPEGWLMDNQFPYDVDTLTDANGSLDTLVNRRYWRHNSPRQLVGGVSQEQHEYHDLTPHILRVFKYGYLPVEQPLDVTPTGNGTGGFSAGYSLLSDEVSLTKSQALDLQSQITIAFHPTPVTWEGLEWDCTITTSLTAIEVYQWIRAVQDEGVKLGGDFLPNFMSSPDRTVRAIHGRSNKSFRLMNTSGNALAGITRMQSKSGVNYIPPMQYTIQFNDLRPDSEVRLFRSADRSEIAGIENSGTSFTYSYIYQADEPFYYVVFHKTYQPIKVTGLVLGQNNQTFLIQQVFDRVYFNP
jgi:hypothetical protein